MALARLVYEIDLRFEHMYEDTEYWAQLAGGLTLFSQFRGEKTSGSSPKFARDVVNLAVKARRRQLSYRALEDDVADWAVVKILDDEKHGRGRHSHRNINQPGPMLLTTGLKEDFDGVRTSRSIGDAEDTEITTAMLAIEGELVVGGKRTVWDQS